MVIKPFIAFILIFLFLLSAFYFLYPKPVNMVKPVLQTKPEIKISMPTEAQILSNNHTWVATIPAEKIRTIIATGDIIPARSVNFKVLQYKDFTWPYLKTYRITRNADITFANLESPLIKNCPVTNEGMIFCGDYRNVEGLKFAGVDIVSLANNHAGNYGQKGVDETINYLKGAGIDATGTTSTNLVIKNIRGVKFAFLGFNDIEKNQPGIANADDKIPEKIAEARKQADVVIVSFHWGTEYKDKPDKRQIDFAHQAIDAGADLIIGNHPHWIQPIEIYKEKLITYAHGNFVFDQMWSQKTREGEIGKYVFYGKQLIDAEFIPVTIDDHGQPH